MTIELGLVAAVLLVAVPAVQLLGALLARSHYKALLEISEELLARPDLTRDDRASLKEFMVEGTSRWPLWVVAITAPLWFAPLLVTAVVDLARRRGTSMEDELEETRRARAYLSEVHGYRDAEHSKGFLARYSEMNDHAFLGSAKLNPLITGWIALWASPALLAFVLFGAAGLARERFRLMVETLLWFVAEAKARFA